MHYNEFKSFHQLSRLKKDWRDFYQGQVRGIIASKIISTDLSDLADKNAAMPQTLAEYAWHRADCVRTSRFTRT
jgi:RecB family endonuclease NucS